MPPVPWGTPPEPTPPDPIGVPPVPTPVPPVPNGCPESLPEAPPLLFEPVSAVESEPQALVATTAMMAPNETNPMERQGMFMVILFQLNRPLDPIVCANRAVSSVDVRRKHVISIFPAFEQTERNFRSSRGSELAISKSTRRRRITRTRTAAEAHFVRHDRCS
jgi:hypothetical protein